MYAEDTGNWMYLMTEDELLQKRSPDKKIKGLS